MAINGTITLKSGEIINVTDEEVVKNSLTVSMSTCPYSKFLIGSFTAAEMKLKIYDNDALEHEFSGAVIELTATEGEHVTPLGIYTVDGSQSVRIKNQIALTAYDRALEFDETFPEDETDVWRTTEYTPLTALQAICTHIGVPLAAVSEDLSEFPNYDFAFRLEAKCIKTYRDAVMHIAALLCANAVINRAGKLEIRRIKYRSEDGHTVNNWNISGDERVKTQFSDIRTFLNEVEVTTGDGSSYFVHLTDGWQPSDEQARGASSRVWCALMKNKQTGIAWLEYIATFKQRRVKTQIFPNARIKLGDCCRFSGGSIDVRRSIVGVVTGIKWKYNGLTEIQCAAPEARY